MYCTYCIYCTGTVLDMYCILLLVFFPACMWGYIYLLSDYNFLFFFFFFFLGGFFFCFFFFFLPFFFFTLMLW